MENFNLTQTGQEVQEILDGAAMLSDLNTEKERAEREEQALQGAIDDEALARQNADGVLQGKIDDEETRAKAAEKQNADDIDAIEEKIPNQASSSNQLADKEYVEDLVSTASATFRGTFNLVSDLHLTIDASRSDIAAALGNAIATADNNDYAFVLIPTSVDTPNEIASIEKYKFNGTVWGFEYVLNNSGFTAAQWAAINSGITSGLVAKLGSLPTASELETALLAKQDVLTFDSAPTPGSLNPVTSAGIHTAIDTEKGARQNADAALQQAIEAILVLIPSAATALNQLADKAFVNSSIATDTSTFRGTYNLVTDLHLAVNASHSDIATALLTAASSADNNDYCFVQVPTSVDTPTEIRVTERYKFDGTEWAYEYDLNNSGFTAQQWEAINSAITSNLVSKLSALPTASELATELAGKQAVLTFDNQPTSGSSNPVKSGGVYDVVAAINAKIPSDADAANKMTTEARIATIIGALDATFDLTSADGHITFKMTQTDGLIASVQILTYDIASAAALTTLGGRVSLNESDISNLQAAYAALTQSDIVIVNGALPSSGQQQNIIYRQLDPDHTPPQFYSDYMWNGSNWVLMATYNNAIDDEPTAGSNNLVKSGGVFDSEMLASQIIRENLELDGDITNVESYEVGLLLKDGTLANYDWYRTYTVANNRTDNRFIFVKAYHFGGLPDVFYTFALIRQSDGKVVCGGRLQGFQIIGVEWGYTLKISQDTNMGNIGVSYSLSTREKNRDEITQLNNLINGIKINIDNGYVYAGIAIPTSTPVSGKVFYLAVIAGTYTNFGGLVVTQGINILKYNGTAWLQEQLIEIDDVPIAGSNNLVKSGGVFDSEMLASQVIRPNLELDGDITDVTTYEVGLLNKNGNLENYDWYRTYTVANNRTDNRFMFVKAYHFGGLPDVFCTFILIRQSDNKIVARGRLQGFQIIGVEWGYTLKISQDTNIGNVGVSWSISTREKGSAAIAELDNKIAINYNDIVQQFVRTGLELIGNIVYVSNYDIGVLRIDGTIDAGITSWRTYTVVNNEPNNKVLFVEAYHTGNLPDNAYCTFCIYRKSDDKMVLQGRLEGEQIIAINPNYYLKISQYTNFDVRYSDLTIAVGQIFERSTCVWLGTSIPEQGYPQIIREKLRMGIMYNESQGSSMCRKGRVTKGDAFGDDLGLTGVAWQNVVLSLSMTQEEKLFLFKRWTTENRKALMISEDGYTAEQVANVIGYGNMLAGTFVGEDTEPSGLPADKPQDFMNPVYANARKLCYSVSWNNSVDIESGFGTINGKIEKYLNSESFPDLWVFDHGHNDAFDPDINDFKTIPTDKFDRSYFIGAMNYIVSKIFSYNPKAKIIVVGHYTNQIGGTNNPPICTEGQVIFANYWQFPIIKIWELLPFSQAVITTTGYWDANHEWHDTGFDGTNHVGNNYSGINQNPRQINGVWVHDLTMKQVWMWDDLHPSSEKAKNLYADVLASYIYSLNCKDYYIYTQ